MVEKGLRSRRSIGRPPPAAVCLLSCAHNRGSPQWILGQRVAPRLPPHWLRIVLPVGRLVVIEGIDGAGKRTLAKALTDALTHHGLSVTGRAFPRYGEDIHADLAQDALLGRLGDLADSVYAMCLLFALDRRAAADLLRDDLAAYDVVLLDRYTASNAAYGAARLHQSSTGEFVAWIRELEIERFGIPVPHAHLLLSVPVELAAERAVHRERTESGRARDRYESDSGLQARCAAVYEGLAADGWLAPWYVVDGATSVDFGALVDDLTTN
jgi:dTMP kinase